MLEIFPTIASKGAAMMTFRELYKLFFPMQAHKILDYTLRECDLTDTWVCVFPKFKNSYYQNK